MFSKRFWSWVLTASLLVCTTELSFLTGWKLRAPKVEQVADIANLYEASVAIRAGNSYGSGTIFRDKSGELLVLTAAHVVAGCKTAELIQSVFLCGEPLTSNAYAADVIEFSEEFDLALLRPHFSKAFAASKKSWATLYKGAAIPKVGTEVVHVGSMLKLERSITYGTIAGLVRDMDSPGSRPHDQATCAGAPGSSGGGIFDARSGELIGVLCRGASDSIVFFVPSRDINQWLENVLH